VLATNLAHAQIKQLICLPPLGKHPYSIPVWDTCPYVRRDGQAVPDVRYVNNTGALADVVLYNAIVYRVSGSADYSTVAAGFLDTWFINATTKMYPNFNYDQVRRGARSKQGLAVLYSVPCSHCMCALSYHSYALW
jgi:hypothetical protein